MRRVAFLFLGLVLAACGGSSTVGGTGHDAGLDSGGSAGTGGSGGSAGTSGSGGSAGTGGSSGGSAGTGGSTCTPKCQPGFVCCNDKCVTTNNDVNNCGVCGHKCTGTHPYCSGGTCATPSCSAGHTCGGSQFCCGTSCCGAGQLCCLVNGPVPTTTPVCETPNAQGTCPTGCPSCVCASPDTPIATPSGDRAIASLRVGDLVYSVNYGRVVVVPIRQVNRVPVSHHFVMRVKLASGSVLEISARHPTADGRTFGELRAGEKLDGMPIVSAHLEPYKHSATYDILPASDTGAYFAGGVLIGSTLKHNAVRVMAPTAPYSVAP